MEYAPRSRRCSWFTLFATKTARATGHPIAFATAVGVIVVWACFGPSRHYSDTWQLVVNTSTTIVTFLMVFLIQNTQNRDSHAVQIKLDELIRAHKGANNAMLDVEVLDDKDLDALSRHYERLAKQAVERIHERRSKSGRGRSEDEAIVREIERAKLDPPPGEPAASGRA